MARSIQDIKKSMTDAFMSDETLREAYGITGDATWENTFSKVSLENMLLYIVACCAYTLEVMFDNFREDVDERIEANIVPTVRWYHTQSLAFQYGDQLVYDEDRQTFAYAVNDSTKQVVKYCAVQDRGGSIQVLVSTDSGGKPTPLSDNILTAFKSYLNQVKIAGVILDIKSIPADSIQIDAVIQINPQVIDTNGKKISDGSYPVVDAIDGYLANIVYGGTFNRTKCIDAIQNVEGVVDVILGNVKTKSSDEEMYKDVEGNNYTARGGCFISDGLKSSISYVVQY